MGCDPKDGPPPGEFPPYNVEKTIGDATENTDGWELRISPAGRFPAYCDAGDNVDVYIQTP